MRTTDQRCGRGEPGLSRRRLLRLAAGTAVGATAAVALSGCDDDTGQAGPASIDPLTNFYVETARLADLYDATIAAHPSLDSRIASLRDHHDAHLTALARELALPDGTGASAGPVVRSASPRIAGSSLPDVPPQEDEALSALLAAEKAATKAAREECLSAPNWRAPLLGAIAACRATHVEVLT